jgi:cytochrome c oxidase assembly factor CtaG
MKLMYRNWTELLHDCIIVLILSGTAGIAVKFTTFFDKWVYFPSFPNICDAAFLILSVAYLAWRAKRPRKSKNRLKFK